MKENSCYSILCYQRSNKGILQHLTCLVLAEESQGDTFCFLYVCQTAIGQNYMVVIFVVLGSTAGALNNICGMSQKSNCQNKRWVNTYITF